MRSSALCAAAALCNSAELEVRARDDSVDRSSSFDASSVASLLREFAQRTALRAGNPFRAKAYARATDNLLALSLPLDQVIAEDRLREIPGIGIAIEDIVKRLPYHWDPSCA